MGANKPIDITPYKPATVYTGKTEQFVSFSYYSKSENKYIREKVRYTMPGVRLSKSERMQGLRDVCNDLNRIISHRNKEGIYHEDIVKPGINGVNTFLYWMEHYSNDASILKSTQRTISSLIYNYKKFLKLNPVFENNTPAQVTDVLVKQFVKYLQADGKVGKTINDYLWAMSFVYEKLLSDKLADSKIDFDKYRVKQGRNVTGKYRPLTDEEKDKVFDYFRERDPGYYLYLLSIYYTCIRPTELKRLKISDFDIAGKKIFVDWYKSKNGLSRYVQILQPLLNELKQQGIQKKPNEYYLFSSGWVPGSNPHTGKWASDKWRIACNKIGIDSTANMYGLKHTFNVDYVENNKNNIDWEWLRRHNRHATIQQTQEYISGLTAFFLDETKSIIKDYTRSNNT